MFRLALAQLRRRPGRYLSLFVAVFAAVALTVSTAAISLTLQNTVSNLFAKPYDQAQAVVSVRGSGTDARAAVDTIRNQPGVTAVAYDGVISAAMKPDDGTTYTNTYVQALDPQLQWRDLIDGALPTADDQVAVPEGTAKVGEQLTVFLPGTPKTAATQPAMDSEQPAIDPEQLPEGVNVEDLSPEELAAFAAQQAQQAQQTAATDEAAPTNEHTVTVVGEVEASARERLIGAETLFVAPQTLEDWGVPAGTGEIRVAASGMGDGALVQEIKQATAGNAAVTGVSTAESTATHQANRYLKGRDRYFLLLGIFTLTVAAVAGLVIVSAFSVVAGSRRREFGLLKSIGATTGQIMGSVLGEALVLGTIASVLGAPAGLALARFAGTHAGELGVQVPLAGATLPLWALLCAVVFGIVLTVLGALPAAKAAIKHDVISSLNAASVQQHSVARFVLRIVAGVVLVAAGVGLLGMSPTGGRRDIAIACLGGAAIVFGLVVAGGIIIPKILSTLAPVFSSVPTLQVGLAYMGRQLGRAASIVGIVIAGTALIGAVLAGQTTLGDHLNTRAQGTDDVDVTVTSLQGGIPQPLIDSLRDTYGVVAVQTPDTVRISSGQSSDRAFGLDTAAAAEVFRSNTANTANSTNTNTENTNTANTANTTNGASPGELVLGTYSPLRGTLKKNANATVEIFNQDVPVKVVYGTTPNTFIDPALIPPAPEQVADLLHSTAFVRLDGSPLQGAQSPAMDALKQTLNDSGVPVSVGERFTARQDIVDSTFRILTLATLLTIAAGAIALVGVTNTVSLAVAERAKDRDLLSAIGFTSGNHHVAMFVELLALTMPGALVGMLVGNFTGNRIAEIVTNSPASISLIANPTAFTLVLALTVVGCLAISTAQSMRK